MLTMVVELPALRILMRDFDHRTVFFCGFIMNLLSFPVQWVILPFLYPADLALVYGVLYALLFEFIFLHRCLDNEKLVYVFMLSLTINFLSFLLSITFFFFQ